MILKGFLKYFNGHYGKFSHQFLHLLPRLSEIFFGQTQFTVDNSFSVPDMSSFPPSNWEVRFLKDMEALEVEPPDSDGVHLQALLAARPADGLEGSFLFTLRGRGHLQLLVPVDSILQLPEFAGMSIEAELRLGTHVKLDKNSACSPWLDVVERIQSQDIDVVREDGSSASEEFISLLEKARKLPGNEKLGIVWRWLLGTPLGDPKLLLMTQALPCTIGVTEDNPALKSDHAMGVIVSKTPVLYDSFDDPSVLGPVPTFFSNEPDRTLRELRESPDYAYQCIQALVSKLLARRELSR